MTTIEQARQLYQEAYEVDAGSHFLYDLAWHLESGYVFSTPCEIIMGREVSTKWTHEQIVDLDEREVGIDTVFDCWHIHLAVGDLRQMLRLLPYKLPFISFQRRGGPLKIIPLERILKNEKSQAT